MWRFCVNAFAGALAFHVLATRSGAFELSPKRAGRLKADIKRLSQEKQMQDAAIAEGILAHKSMPQQHFLEQVYLSVGESAVLANIQYYMMFLYVVPSVALFVMMIIFRRMSGIEAKIEEKKKASNDLRADYDGLISDMEDSLKKMTGMQIELIEHNFDDIRNDFQDFFEHASRHKDYYPQELLEPLRVFILRWMSSYNDWLLDPSEDPAPVVTKKDMDACSDIVGLATLMVSRLQDCDVILTAEFGGKKTGKTQQNAGEIPPPLLCSWMQCCGLNRGYLYVKEKDKDGYPVSFGPKWLGVTIFSPKHAMILASFLLGPLIAAVEVFLGGSFGMLYAAYICGSLLLLLYILVSFERVDELARVELEIIALQTKREQVEKQHTQVTKRYELTTKYTTLWQYRSLPVLGLMKAVRVQVRDNPQKGVMLLEAANKELATLEEDLGPRSYWYGPETPLDQLQDASQLIERSERFVSDQEVDQTLNHIRFLFHPFRMLSVRVIEASDLSGGSMLEFGSVDPYVRARLGEAEWKETETIWGEKNPKWPQSQAWHFTPKAGEEDLEIQVYDDNKVRTEKLIGQAKASLFDIDVTHGQWKQMQLKLEKGTGDVTISALHTTDVQSYIDRLKAGPTEP